MKVRYQYRLYPNKEQEQLMKQAGGSCRWLWNKLLEGNCGWYNIFGLFKFKYDLINLLPKLKSQNLWLSDTYSQSLQQVAYDLDQAFQNKFKHGFGFPKFKKKTLLRDSFRYIQHTKVTGRKGRYRILHLPKIGDVRIRLHRTLPKYTSVTIIQKGNKWFASFVVERKEKDKVKPKKFLGIDLGINSFATDSNGTQYTKENQTTKHEKNLAKKQQKLSCKEYGSNNYLKQLIQVININLRIRNQRKDFLHKLSNQITNDYDLIYVEDLNISGMIRNKHLSKSISDQGWGAFLHMLSYKSLLKGKETIKIGRFEPSSKICSGCGNIQDIPLHIRQYECLACGLSLDRDINAAINILQIGIRDHTSGTEEIYACGDTSTGDLLRSRSRHVSLKQEAKCSLDACVVHSK